MAGLPGLVYRIQIILLNRRMRPLARRFIYRKLIEEYFYRQQHDTTVGFFAFLVTGAISINYLDKYYPG